MRSAVSYRGQPLVVLVLLLGGWTALRAMVWDGGSPMPAERIAPVLRPEAGAPEVESPVAYAGMPSDALSRSVRPLAPDLALPPARFSPVRLPPREASAFASPVPARVVAGSQALWMAAPADPPFPPGPIVLSPPAAAPAAALSAESAVSAPASSPSSPMALRDPRWSADAWLLLRRGGTVPAAGGLAPATYGASQAGAVVRYRLAPESGHRPALHLRGSAALNGSRERETALGVSARPVAGLPIVVAAEARVNGQPGDTRVRPAAFAHTALPPFALPARTRAEVYAQAGYVGGNFASAFVDGQLRMDREVLRLGGGALRAGAGVWGGAQKGASRLDLGPTATVGMPMGGSAGARLGVDWRFRVAGDAEPSSGPALTLSAGF